MTRIRLAIATLALALICTAAYAGISLQAYTRASPPAVYRSGLSIADPLNSSQPISAATARASRGNTDVGVSAGFSAGPGTTVELRLIRFDKDSAGAFSRYGVTTRTVTAGSTDDDGAGNTLADDAIFDTSGASHYEVRIGPPSAGNVTLTVWSFGAAKGE